MVRFIRYIILIALLQAVAGIFLSHAQSFTSASGIVKDSITGEPLPFVSVYFDGSTIGAMTDDNGTFTLQNNQGYTKLAAASLGYDTKFIDLKPGKKNDNSTTAENTTAIRICKTIICLLVPLLQILQAYRKVRMCLLSDFQDNADMKSGINQNDLQKLQM